MYAIQCFMWKVGVSYIKKSNFNKQTKEMFWGHSGVHLPVDRIEKGRGGVWYMAKLHKDGTPTQDFLFFFF